MYTLRDVARLADVSIATASAVINNKGRVSEKLRARVASAMRALDYHPDQVARSLKVRRTNTIGMLIPDVTNPFFTAVMQGVEDEARRNGYSVIMCNASEDPELERRQLNLLYSRRVDGALMAPADPSTPQDRSILRRFPVVLFDRAPRNFRGSAVITDNLGAALDATRHLIELGHQRIAIITGRLDLPNAMERLEGFRQALQEAHLPIREEYLRRGDFRLASGYQSGLELMHLGEPPTAIFPCNNSMTLGLMRALGELRIACPERVSVLGFDDFEWAANFTPRLSTVAQPSYEMGRRATELLLRKLARTTKGRASESNGDQVIVLSNELRIRDSTAPPYDLKGASVVIG